MEWSNSAEDEPLATSGLPEGSSRAGLRNTPRPHYSVPAGAGHRADTPTWLPDPRNTLKVGNKSLGRLGNFRERAKAKSLSLTPQSMDTESLNLMNAWLSAKPF